MEKEFLRFVASVMEIDTSDISFEFSYKDNEKWDSLMMLTLIMEIEAEYNVTIPIEDVEKIEKIGDLYRYVNP